MTKSNKGALDGSCNVHLALIQCTWFQLPKTQALPSLRQAWLHLTPVVLRVFKEIHIEISVHIRAGNFKRIIRTSDHPWKLQFTSTLIFQSVTVLPLKGINTCVWGHFIVQMVGYPANLSFHISLMCLLCRPWSSSTERSSETWGAKRGDGSNQLWRATCTTPAKLLISTDKVWASANPSQSGFLSMWQSFTDRHRFDGWGRKELKMGH